MTGQGGQIMFQAWWVGPVVFAGGWVGLADQPPDPGVVTVPAPAVKPDAVNQGCSGVLLSLTKDAIVVQDEDTRQPHRFRISAVLAGGGFEKNRAPTHKLAELRYGDRVNIDYWRKDGVEVCEAVCVLRRPGGLIPPAHGEHPNTPIRFHEGAQARQDRDEKGIPLPAKFAPPIGDSLWVIPPIPPAKP
jgi:hypothetical protein